jgi:rhodanese-related sulfurtransferase/ABC-type phosphate/phosphonate transport system substrate-binding protein
MQVGALLMGFAMIFDLNVSSLLVDRANAVGKFALATIITCASWQAAAQMRAMVAVDPSTTTGRSLLIQQADSSLEAVVGQPVQMDSSTDFANILRSTRTGEYSLYIAPPHVAASAMNHGYQVIASNATQDVFVLVVRQEIDSVAQLKGKKIYLPHQDSLHSYMAKGLINENGGALSQASKVDYQRTSGAGLVALQMGSFDATVVRKSEFVEWQKTAKSSGKVLIESTPVPSGMTLVVKRDMPEPLKQKVASWATSGSTMLQTGFGAMKSAADGDQVNGYKYLTGLGHFTPTALPKVQRIDVAAAANLMKQGAVLVDVRTEKEFKAKRIPGAVLAPYVEKSLKETTFNASLDDFSAADKLDKSKPTIFSCNGAECWKSYKASQVALSKGFQKVFWLRGGLPEWEAAGMPLAKE